MDRIAELTSETSLLARARFLRLHALAYTEMANAFREEARRLDQRVKRPRPTARC